MGRNSMLKGLDAFGKVCMPSAHHAPLYVLIAPSWADDGGREGQDGLRGCLCVRPRPKKSGLSSLTTYVRSNAILVLSYRGTHTYRVYRLPPHTPSPFNSKSSVLTTIKNRSKLTHHIKQLVDKSRGEKLVVNMNITFPKVPCYRTVPPFPYPLSRLTSPSTFYKQFSAWTSWIFRVNIRTVTLFNNIEFDLLLKRARICRCQPRHSKKSPKC